MASVSEEVLLLTQDLLRFNTINPPGQEKACVDFLAERLEGSGFEVGTYEFSAGRPTLVARLRGGGENLPLCYAGHIDTVPLGDSQWTRDPFCGEVDGDKLYGRGASDMKGGIAACVVSALEMAKHPHRQADILLVIAASEETGCEGSAYVASLKDVLGEAGGLIIAEPTSNRLFIGHKGVLWLELKTRGIAAHGSMPGQGVNAIYAAAEAVLKLRDADLGYPSHPVLGAATLNVGTIAGGTRINIVPDQVSIQVDIRTVPGRTSDETISDLKRVLGADVEINSLFDLDAVATDPDNRWIQEVSAIVSRYSDNPAPPKGLPYFTDAAVLTPAFNSVPTIILGPGEAEMAHRTDEFCFIPRLFEAVEIYSEISRRWCKVSDA
ncbi:MAG: M20 family metallopeptidase [Deltaproteobacteria bacterium]|nr:M20 family metallopeptidase [Deltaproteobacteria bacterium]